MWCVARRVSVRSSATLRRPLALLAPTQDAPVRALHARTLSSTRERPQADQTPSLGGHVDANQARAHRCLGDLLYALRFARTPKQLTTMWSILLRRDPVVVAKKMFLRPVGSRLQPKDADSARVTIPDDSLAVRMVSAAELRELIEQGKRETVVESFPSRSKKSLQAGTDTSGSSSELCGGFVSPDRVLLVSERCIARTILGTHFYMDHYLAFTQFLEEYEAENRLLLTRDPTALADLELATLGDDMNPWYMEALGHLEEHTKLVEQYERRGGADLLPYLMRRKAIRALLDACVRERDAHLARTIVDQTLDRSMLYTFTSRSFTLTLQACLHGDKTLERLQHAMHIYRRMRHETGFALRPKEWSLLVHAAVFLGQHEQALEVFRAYRAHGIVPFQRRFQQAIHTACQYTQYDTAIAMVRACIEQERKASTEELDATNISNTLWYMLKGTPSRDHVQQFLDLMQSRRFEAGPHVLRRVVAHHFATATDDDHLDAETVVSQFFDLWECVPDTILRNRFVLQLVLEECESRDWEDQMERVLEYANENEIELPIVVSSMKQRKPVHGVW